MTFFSHRAMLVFIFFTLNIKNLNLKTTLCFLGFLSAVFTFLWQSDNSSVTNIQKIRKKEIAKGANAFSTLLLFLLDRRLNLIMKIRGVDIYPGQKMWDSFKANNVS